MRCGKRWRGGACGLGWALAVILARPAAADDWISLFDGESLAGWHVSARSGHSAASGHRSGGRWVVEDGAITGQQDMPGNGGLLLTEREFSAFEVVLEMRNDFGPDSGLFLRSSEEGVAYQAMIDYHRGGNLMGVYGEGLGGIPHVRNFSFGDRPTEIVVSPPGESPLDFPVLRDGWASFWRDGQWNELRARIEGEERPTITTWINGVKIMEWTESEARHRVRGAIGLQIHGGGDAADYASKQVRYRNLRVRILE